MFTNPSPETDDSLGAAVKFIQNWKDSEEKTRGYPCIGPHAPYSVSGPLIKEITELSLCYDLLIHTHISETQDENNQIREQTGMSPIQWLDSLGVFERPTLAAHSIHLPPEDMEIYRRNGVHATYKPVSNMKLASGIMQYLKMREMGI